MPNALDPTKQNDIAEFLENVSHFSDPVMTHNGAITGLVEKVIHSNRKELQLVIDEAGGLQASTTHPPIPLPTSDDRLVFLDTIDAVVNAGKTFQNCFGDNYIDKVREGAGEFFLFVFNDSMTEQRACAAVTANGEAVTIKGPRNESDGHERAIEMARQLLDAWAVELNEALSDSVISQLQYSGAGEPRWE